MADATALGAVGSNPMGVQVSPSAHKNSLVAPDINRDRRKPKKYFQNEFLPKFRSGKGSRYTYSTARLNDRKSLLK